MDDTREIAGLGLIRTKEIIRDEICDEARKKKIKSEPTIEIEIGSLKVESLIDTGAQISAITRELLL